MPLTVTIYFDTETEFRIRKVWEELHAKTQAKYMHDSGNIPHIKLAVFDNLDISACRQKLYGYAKEHHSFSITFKYIGIFPKNHNVFLGPGKNIELYNLQKDIFNILQDSSEISNDYRGQNSHPSLWIPDCIVARRIEMSEMQTIYRIISKVNLPLEAKVTEIGLFEFFPVKLIDSFKLRD